jgi:hypothetical protein
MKIFFDVFIFAELNRLSVGGRLHNFFNGRHASKSKKSDEFNGANRIEID